MAAVARLSSVAEIERRLGELRAEPGADDDAQMRTNVMTHIAWVPEEWVPAAEDVLGGLKERHPSRTIVLLPQPDAADGLDADVAVECFRVGSGSRSVCTDTIRVRLGGTRAEV